MDPYVYPGTDVLINKLNVRDPEKLAIIEGRFFALKNLDPMPIGKFDYDHLKAIHYHFFNDLYTWAGQERTVDIAKQNSYFAHTPFIASGLNKLFKNLKNDDHYLTDLNCSQFCSKISYYFNEINAAHPFREGNGRTQRAFCSALAEHAGYYLDWSILQNRAQDYTQASIEGFLHANYTAMTNIFIEITSPLNRSHEHDLHNIILNSEIIDNLKIYVDEQLKLTELVNQKNQSIVHDPNRANNFSQKAIELDKKLKLTSKNLIEKNEAKSLLKHPQIISLQKQGGFSAIQQRLQKNEIIAHDILAVLRYAKSQAIALSQSLNEDQHQGKGRRR